MHLQTSIKPRSDGTVEVAGLDGATYTFLPDAKTGDLVCGIEHEGTIAHLLSLESFMPVDEADFAVALALAGVLTDDDEDGGNHPDDEKPDPNALPLEANTPPAKSAKPAKAKQALKD